MQNAAVLRVGLMVRLGGMWQGGVNYYRSLIACFAKYGDDGIELNVFSDQPERLREFENHRVRVHKTDLLAGFGSVAAVADRVGERISGVHPLMYRMMDKAKIDVLSHNGIGRQRRFPTAPWMPDFQHRVYPSFFSEAELRLRDESIGETRYLGNLLLSSHAAEADFRKYYPALSEVRTFVMHFASGSASRSVPLPFSDLQSRYPLRDRYIYVPNQFWQHKNHTVIVEALHLAPDNVQVVCTGAMEDYRNRDYVPELMAKAQEYHLGERFLCLGHIPYRDVEALMHHSTALLNPSLFEGWSTTVEEAKALCKRVILSDIAVHREQAPLRGAYFPPHDAKALSDLMQAVYGEYDPAVESQFVSDRDAYRERVEREFALEYGQIVKALGAR